MSSEPYSPVFEDAGSSAVDAQLRGATRWFQITKLEAILALLVTDLEGFTPLVQRLGDAAAQRLIRVHNQLLRECLGALGGAEVAHTGDGVLAAFRSVNCALTCAAQMQRRLDEHTRLHPEAPLRARIGVHAGEPLPEDGRLFGTCVITAVRICSVAQACHVLVSDVVRQLAIGKTADFADRGMFPLKGLAAPVRLHELIWCQPPETHDQARPLNR